MHNDYYNLSELQKFLDNFRLTEFWKTMENTVENSPWHREANVAVHTEMTMKAAQEHILANYGQTIEQQNTVEYKRHMTLVMLALCFHDTGKPTAEVEKESESRGVYRSYAGHERFSARTFESYAVDNWNLLERLITINDVYLITWMIEHHLPYGVKNQGKIDLFCGALNTMFGPINGPEVFFSMLIGDQTGRISDNHEFNQQNMLTWIAETKAACEKVKNTPARKSDPNKVMIMLVGAPGSGKSTTRNEMSTDYSIFSLDDIRLEYARIHYKDSPPVDAVEEYRRSFELCMNEEKLFTAWSNQLLHLMFKYQSHIVIDNTNGSVKTRRQYLDLAKRNNMMTIAYYIPASVELLKQRNKTRGDKMLPVHVIERIYEGTSVPSYGDHAEFDEVRILGHNYGYNRTTTD